MSKTRPASASILDSVDTIPNPSTATDLLRTKESAIKNSGLTKNFKTKLISCINELLKINAKAPSYNEIFVPVDKVLPLVTKIRETEEAANVLSDEAICLIKKFNKDFDKMEKKDRNAAISLTLQDYSTYHAKFKNFSQFVGVLKENSNQLNELMLILKKVHSKKTAPDHFKSLLKQLDKFEQKTEKLKEKLNNFDDFHFFLHLDIATETCRKMYEFFASDDILKIAHGSAHSSIKSANEALKIIEPLSIKFRIVTEARNNILQAHQAKNKSTMFSNSANNNADKGLANNESRKTPSKQS